MFYVNFVTNYLDDDGSTVSGTATLEFDTLEEARAFMAENPDAECELLD